MTALPIRAMFNSLVPEYDRFNRFSSMGLDVLWRRRLANLFKPEDYVLDVGTGTGDLAKSIAKNGSRVLGIDFSENMIEAAKQKLHRFPNVSFQIAEADRLPFQPHTFTGISSAFVIRNLHHGEILAPSLREFHRVLKTNGLMVHLELTRPYNTVVNRGHKAYLDVVLPMIGKTMFRERWPKNYLAQTIQDFPSPQTLCQMFRWAGFERVEHHSLFGGIAGLFVGVKC